MCGSQRLYAAPLCSRCGSASFHLASASGEGEIYSFTVVPQQGASPERVVLLVTLTEGVRVLGSLIGSASPIIGGRVRIAPGGLTTGPIMFRMVAEP